MNADDLRAVAREIREKAEPMLRGAPWRDDRGRVATSKGFVLTGHSGMLASAHIAAWHPGVALAVAEWLDLLGSQEECDWSPEMWARGVAFVQAWRGEQS